MTAQTKFKPLGQRLLESGLVSQLQLDLALREQKRQGRMLGEVLVDLGFVNPEVLTGTLASENKTAVVDVANISVDSDVLELISYEDAKKFKLIPLDLDKQILTVAFADAFDVVAIDTIERQTGYTLNVVTAAQYAVEEAIEHNYSHGQTIGQTIDLLLEQGISASDEGVENISPMVRLVDQIIAFGIKQDAADIHLEPAEKVLRVRFRIDGVLKTQLLIPAVLMPALTARLKLLAKMNVSQKRKPQDGRINFSFGNKKIDLRISTMPTNFGESVVMRILDKSSVKLSVDWLGMTASDSAAFCRLIDKPHGMVLITGPTGSGKTTTLYTALSTIDTESRSVFTLEDPIEYSLPGIRQTQIDAAQGMDFAAGLKALLRQDPDVILIGEIRDRETAELAIRAALTGHLVLSTLHTNSACGVVPRLIDMGVANYLLPPALAAAIGQRLVRKLCADCKTLVEDKQGYLNRFSLSAEDFDEGDIYRACGCDKCNQTGFKGRLAIYEVFVVDEAMHQAIMDNIGTEQLQKLARQRGMQTMLDDGLAKVRQGLTSVDEIMRLVSC